MSQAYNTESKHTILNVMGYFWHSQTFGSLYLLTQCNLQPNLNERPCRKIEFVARSWHIKKSYYIRGRASIKYIYLQSTTNTGFILWHKYTIGSIQFLLQYSYLLQKYKNIDKYAKKIFLKFWCR